MEKFKKIEVRMKIRMASQLGLLILILVAGCTFPRLGLATQPPATPLPKLTPTFPPSPTETPITLNVIHHFVSDTQLTLSNIHMFSLTNGWAIGTASTEPNAHILHTSDGGLTWKDFTPPEPLDSNGSKQAIAYFADDNNLWVSYAIVQSTLISNPNLTTVVWASHDGGKAWTSSAPLQTVSSPEFFTPGNITFADLQHGWLLVHVGVGMSHDYSFLYSTVDGGYTWTRIADPTVASTFPQVCCKADLAFNDPFDLWLVGNTNGVVPGIFFYHSTDGGKTWALVSLPAPSAYPNLYTTQDYACGTYEIQFVDANNGFVGVECFAQIKAANLGWLYTTNNGGGTWVPQNVPQPQGLFHFNSAGQGWYVADKVYRTSNGGLQWLPGAAITWSGVPDFVDAKNGWLVASKEGALALVHSTDAGASWSIITPIVAP
jgi:photosystem II stability/assembly factor-like uncharacterized protein